jgi:hypothetical protein
MSLMSYLIFKGRGLLSARYAATAIVFLCMSAVSSQVLDKKSADYVGRDACEHVILSS